MISDKILIADDDPTVGKILTQELARKGFAVDTVTCARRGQRGMPGTVPGS